ncbi:MAG: FAD-binding oxidoreductase [Thermomicrobiales bacterium]
MTHAPAPVSQAAGLPASYWHATFAPPVPDDPLPAETEVAVIGGGMLGCWTAFWLAQQGVQVTVIEREVISWGATGRNGGFLVGGAALGYADAIASFGRDAAMAIWALAEEGRALAAGTIAEEGIACDFRMPGALTLALSDDERAAMARNTELLREDGFAAEVLDRPAVQALIGTPLGDEIAGAALSPQGGLLHSGRYLAGIAAAARRRGARFVRATVSSLAPDDDGVTIETAVGTVRTGRVVVAVNAWSDDLVPALAGLVVPVRGQILAYEPCSPVFTTATGADITPTGEYWQQTPDGSIVIGGCRAVAPNGDVGVREMSPTSDVTDAIEAVLPRLFPALSGLSVARRWAGLMAFTSDYVPVADAVPGMPNVWAAGGFCGHGMPFGPVVGKLLAEAAARGKTPVALQPLRLDRPSLKALAG